MLGVFILFPCGVSLSVTQPLCTAVPLLLALGFTSSTTGFWVSTDENPRSSILCFHFYHNLDSHKSIFCVILITLGLSRAVDFITISMCFLQLACAQMKAQDQAMVHV